MGLITRDFYKSGSHNAISDRSGQKYKRSDMRIEWNGSLVGKDEYEERHPQLILRPHEDDSSIKNQTRVNGFTETLLKATYNPAGGV